MAQVVDFKFDSNKKEIEDAMKDKIHRWLKAIGEDAASTAANVLTETGTIDTGNLKNSISSAVVDSENAVYIGTNVPYAIYHEFGTGKYASGGGGRPTPWMFKDKDGVWHWTHGVHAKHYLQFGATAHQDEYKAMLEQALKQ